MDSAIQQLFDNNNIVNLPIGEFEGPFYIKKPCTVNGNSTTLWAKKGPVLVIDSTGVIIKNLRIEITEQNQNPDYFTSLISNASDAKYEGIEIIGNVKGIKGEENSWYLPQIIPLGDFPAESSASFILEIEIPVEVTIKSTVKDLLIAPRKLTAGRNKVTISSEKLKNGTFLYGELLFESLFIRRSYINGCAKSNLNGYVDNKVLYKAPISNANAGYTNPNLVSAANIIVPMVSDPNIVILQKGQRISIKEIVSNNIRINLSFINTIQQLDIDPYVFLLNKMGKATSDENLIFFANPVSKCGGVKYMEEDGNKSVLIDFKKINDSVQTISIAYSIYGDNPNKNFSKVINPTIRLLSDGNEKIRYSPKDLFIETTIVFIELYRYKNEWKINTVGSGYRDGLKRLCESYGLSVI
jgi:stress response protein SCP2